MSVPGAHRIRQLVGVLMLVAGLTVVLPATQSGAGLVTSNAAPAADLSGYDWINYYRGLGGLRPVARNATYEAQEAVHIRYLANHSLGCESNVHDELTTRYGNCGANPYATAWGKAAANNSNITRVNGPVSDRTAVSNWFVSALHALTLLEPRLHSTGYAAYYTPSPTGAQPEAFKFTAAVDVYRDRTGGYGAQTLTFPATNAVSPLLSYPVGTESPEPFRSTVASSPCHAWGNLAAVSAPVIVQWQIGSHAPQTGGSIIDLSTGRALPTCGLTAAQYPAGSLPRQFLSGTNRLTQAALYYASAPFVAGHRYQLRINGVITTTFGTANLPSAPALTVTPTVRALQLAWTPANPGTGWLANYRVTRFAEPTCLTPAWAATTTARGYTMTGLYTGRWYFVQVQAMNTAGAIRKSQCLITRAR